MSSNAQDSAANDSSDFKMDKFGTDLDGDCILVSSNSFGFRLRSWELRTYSSVFRDMFKDAAPTPEQPIRLLDPDIETADTIMDFVSLAKENVLLMTDNLQELQGQLKLVAFLEKYDCSNLKRVIGDKLQLDIRQKHGHRSLDCFILAAHLDRLDLCMLCLSQQGEQTRSADMADYRARWRDEDFDGHNKPTTSFDIRYLDIKYSNLIPRDYLHALTRCLVQTGEDCKYDWRLTSIKFKECLDEARDARKIDNAPMELPIVRG